MKICIYLLEKGLYYWNVLFTWVDTKQLAIWYKGKLLTSRLKQNKITIQKPDNMEEYDSWEEIK